MNLNSKIKELQRGIHHNTSCNDLHCISEVKCERFLEEFLSNLLADKELEICRLRAVLELIAAPIRPDGTYNRDRAACQDLAQKALSNQ